MCVGQTIEFVCVCACVFGHCLEKDREREREEERGEKKTHLTVMAEQKLYSIIKLDSPIKKEVYCKLLKVKRGGAFTFEEIVNYTFAIAFTSAYRLDEMLKVLDNHAVSYTVLPSADSIDDL